jgi:hypothetical protein
LTALTAIERLDRSGTEERPIAMQKKYFASTASKSPLPPFFHQVTTHDLLF